VETIFFIHTLSIFLLSFIKIYNLPFLGFGSIVTPNLNWVTFFIFTSFDIKDLTVAPVDELVVLIFEDLEPS
jgi:hypothetical protein